MSAWLGSYSWIEEAPANAEEDPDINRQRESEGQRDVQQGPNVHGICSEQGVGDLGSSESEEQEQECADEFSKAGDEHVAGSVGEP